MANYSRPASAERFKFDGIKTNSSPDSLTANKHPYAQNVRGVNDSSIQSRSQLLLNVGPPDPASPVLALEPSIGITKQGSVLTSFATANVIDTGYDSDQGASILPFRPNATPNAWDYVFDDLKLTKVNVAGSPAVVTVEKTGIAEPQNPPEVCPDDMNVVDFSNYGSWVASGSVAGPINQPIQRTSENVLGAIADPASVSPSLATRYSLIPQGNQDYSVGQTINTSFGVQAVIQDIFPPIGIQGVINAGIQIQAIQYVSGSTGPCVIVPSQMPASRAVPGVNESAASIYNETFIASLRRGSVIEIAHSVSVHEFVFVLSVSKGPDGNISFETSTVHTYIAGDFLSGNAALAVAFTQPLPGSFVGVTITSQQANLLISGLASVAVTPLPTNPFTTSPIPSAGEPTAQEDDYIHISLWCNDYSQIVEMKLVFDVNNGTADFQTNAYYYTIRQNDLIAGIKNTLTQLGVAQLVAQRAFIDEEQAAESNNQGTTASSAQTGTGNGQWSEIRFPVSSLTRIGTDESRSLANCQGVQILFNAISSVTVAWSSLWVQNGQDPDVGDTASPMFYRVRPRSQVTGVRGNPSPETRYGVSPRRQQNIVSLPSAAYDSQIDTWDIERQGATLDDWRYVGSTPSTNTEYTDKFFDTTIAESDTDGLVNYEPFPSIGPPITALSATIVGTRMTAVFPTASASPEAAGTLSQLGSLLPGNLFNVGQQVFTLRKRPTSISATGTTQTWLFIFEENAGVQTNPLVLLQEPNLAAQTTNNVWGPDAQGVFFAVMVGTAVTDRSSGLRPGLVQWTNPNNPDAADSKNTKEISNPKEPLINGALLGPTSCGASSKRWWRGIYSEGQDGSANYSWNEAPVGAGLAAQFGICSDGQFIYFVTNDGISRHAGGPRQSLTDADLYNLFPHEGTFPQDITYLGKTVFAPEYAFAESFRLAVVNGFLYFDYLDRNQNQRTLTCDLRRLAWCVDRVDDPAFPQISIHAGTGAPASNFGLPGSAVKNQQLFLGGTDGAVYIEQSSPVAGTGEQVNIVVATREDMFGDLRAKKQFGDAALDILAAGGNITVTPVFFGQLYGTTTTITGGQTTRPDSPYIVNLNGQNLDRSIGLLLTWTDRGATTSLFWWQPSYLTQPEDTSNRFTDWDNAGSEGNKFFQGFEIEADTVNAVKTFKVKDADLLAFHDFTSATGTNQINANGQQVIPCSFNAPFFAHLVRIEPQDFVAWRMFRVKWIAQPTPELALTWTTQPTSFGFEGYIHAKEVLACYASTQPVTVTVTCFDGLSPAVLTLPSTGGAVQKILLPLTPNKGLLYTFSGVSTAPWQCYQDAWEILVKPWGSQGPYQRVKNLGSGHGDTAPI